MNKTFTSILLLASFLFSIEAIQASIKLPAIVSSNMVLQRNTTVVLWGWADANENISLETSWIQNDFNFQADANGDWSIEVKTTTSKKSQTIRIKSDASDITLYNVLFGEVWLCSGQSNMEQPLKGFKGQPTFGANSAITKAHNPNLRLFTVEKMGSRTPLNDAKKVRPWEEATPENAANFSAIGYFYGKQLQETLDVPVGIIHTSWGGSFVEAWISKDVLSKYQDIDIAEADLSKSNRVQTALFNAMINPIIPYTIKGALWYQGESNRNEPEAYKELFPAMVKDWRDRWNIDDFPFYFAQIAPFSYGTGNTALIREAQLDCVNLIPNSGIAITMDIGDQFSIHPPKKKEVADRLLYNALNQTYGIKTIDFQGPTYKSHQVIKGGVQLEFNHVESGIYAINGLKNFEIAGEDKIFYPGEATIIQRNKVMVKSSEVPNPVAVRYAWKNWVEGTLFDTYMLPASSFRTDKWIDNE